MRQEAFERSRRARWSRFEEMLKDLEAGREGAAADFPQSYRRVCQDLALARDRGFGTSLVDRLNGLALRGHQLLYGPELTRVGPIQFLAREFPRAVRREARLLGIMSAVFYGSALLLFALDLRSPDLVYSLLSPDRVEEFEAMYDPKAPHYGAPRGTIGDFSAFAFYVSNNVGIAFRVFAWGIFAGVGSLLLLLFNGVMFGLVAAHITLAGQAGTFFPFVVGHGALELTAIILAATTGMKLGWSLVAPGRLRRRVALVQAARESVPLLYGMVAMLLGAAVVEAFWSATPWIPTSSKLAVGAALWLGVGAWLALGGRTRAH